MLNYEQLIKLFFYKNVLYKKAPLKYSTPSTVNHKLPTINYKLNYMSGHSKWSKIKRKKGDSDQKRGNLFTKLSKAVTIAARDGGGDPASNFKLRLAIDKAKAGSVPKDTIDKAIKRGTGELEGGQIEEIVYEGFGPGGTAIIIETLTDNKNRTVASVKHILSKYGGSLGSSNSVLWQFERKGIIRLLKTTTQNKDQDEFQLQMIDAGAEDIQEEDDELILITKLEDLQKTKEALEKMDIAVENAELEYIAKEDIKLDDNAKQTLEKLFASLDEDDDVNNFFSNAEI